VMMYTQDYDEIYPRKTPNYKPLILPYLKNEALLRCPSDTQQTLSYRFNKNLQGRSLGEVAQPDKTVMLYEGNDAGPIYRHEGKAAIVFADGHAKLMTQEEIKEAIWTLPAKKPAPPKGNKRR
jgi:prepilin-type processing-associated H-X9-DG protein